MTEPWPFIVLCLCVLSLCVAIWLLNDRVIELEEHHAHPTTESMECLIDSLSGKINCWKATDTEKP